MNTWSGIRLPVVFRVGRGVPRPPGQWILRAIVTDNCSIGSAHKVLADAVIAHASIPEPQTSERLGEFIQDVMIQSMMEAGHVFKW